VRQKNTPNDPDRRERILAATIATLEEAGIGGVTARSVAARAGVPVGSVSYHFASVRELLLESSKRVVETRVAALASWSQTVTPPTLFDRLAELVHEQITDGRALTVIAYELYILGLRDDEFGALSRSVIDALRSTLAPLCGDAEADSLAATADGLQLAAIVQNPPPTVAAISRALRRSDSRQEY
jgi:TetR/AcrR family transcriptional regulator, regulator of biofilm formation and stress response